MRKELEKHHSECVGYLQNQIKLKDDMIKKQAQEGISPLFGITNKQFCDKESGLLPNPQKKIERMRINERIYGRGRRSISPQVPPGGWGRDDDDDSDCKYCCST